MTKLAQKHRQQQQHHAHGAQAQKGLAVERMEDAAVACGEKNGFVRTRRYSGCRCRQNFISKAGAGVLVPDLGAAVGGDTLGRTGPGAEAAHFSQIFDVVKVVGPGDNATFVGSLGKVPNPFVGSTLQRSRWSKNPSTIYNLSK